MEVIEQAVEKIEKEMKEKNSTYINVIGSYVLKQLEVNKPVCEEIIKGNKTIAGSVEEMRREAKKNAKDGIAVLTDEEGFAIVSKYFGFEGVQPTVEEAIVQAKVIEIHKKEQPKKKFEADINDFM